MYFQYDKLISLIFFLFGLNQSAKSTKNDGLILFWFFSNTESNVQNLGKPIHLLEAEGLLLSYETNNWFLLYDLNNKTLLETIYLETG